MKDFKLKIQNFLNSEEGRVDVKTPLTLGITAGGILLAQAGTAPKVNAFEACSNDADAAQMKPENLDALESSGSIGVQLIRSGFLTQHEGGVMFVSKVG